VILQASNLLYVDQPTGTGFSYTSDKRDIRHNEDGVSNDLYDFLQVCVSIINRNVIQYNFPQLIDLCIIML
jgi:carboxypeptidase C (cathepsin A)